MRNFPTLVDNLLISAIPSSLLGDKAPGKRNSPLPRTDCDKTAFPASQRHTTPKPPPPTSYREKRIVQFTTEEETLQSAVPISHIWGKDCKGGWGGFFFLLLPPNDELAEARKRKSPFIPGKGEEDLPNFFLLLLLLLFLERMIFAKPTLSQIQKNSAT